MARTARLRRGSTRSLGRTAIDTLAFIVALAMVVAALKFSGLLSIESGPVRVLDGDSIRRGDVEIRLSGIDAPEYQQTCKDENGEDWPCGRASARALRSMIGGRDVACEIHDTDRYGRLVAQCRSGDIDLNREMIRQGWAVTFSTAGLVFASIEAEARAAKRGIWRGRFETPQDWRKRHQTSRGDVGGSNAPQD